jgi:flagellar motor switch protein FliN
MSEDDTTDPTEAAPEPSPATPEPGRQPPTSGTEPPLEDMGAATVDRPAPDTGEHGAADLEAVFDVPVRVSAVLGRTRIPVASLLKMDVGTIVELNRQVGEAIDIYVNDRLIARGEIVLVDQRLGITMTEIIKAA